MQKKDLLAIIFASGVVLSLALLSGNAAITGKAIDRQGVCQYDEDCPNSQVCCLLSGDRGVCSSDPCALAGGNRIFRGSQALEFENGEKTSFVFYTVLFLMIGGLLFLYAVLQYPKEEYT